MNDVINTQEAVKLVADYLFNLMSPRCIGLTPDHCWKEAEDILAEAQSADCPNFGADMRDEEHGL